MAKIPVHLLEKAKQVLTTDQDLLTAKKSFIFKHPRFVDHAKMQTVIYRQVYVQKLTTGLQEWDLIGSDVRIHYYPVNQSYALEKNIERSSKKIDLENLIAESTIRQNISNWLGLTFLSTFPDIQIHHRLRNLTPVYWINIPASVLRQSGLYGRHARVLVVDAKTGNLLSQFSNFRSINHQVKIFDGRFHILKSAKVSEQKIEDLNFASRFKNFCELISTQKENFGEPLLININKCELGKDVSAARALKNTTDILNYYESEHGQWGFDNDRQKNTPVVSIVHVGDHFDNAYWDEDNQFMVYGDGAKNEDKNSTGDYTLALDISGHEFTHAIVSKTADFGADSDAGALNEGFADIFGILIERKQDKFANWNIGAKLYSNNDGESDEIALRSISNPRKFKTSSFISGQFTQVPFPEKYSDRLAKNEKCSDENDQCEVHANSTIWSHTAYLIDQGFQNDLNMSAEQADQKMSQLYFLTLTHKLHENETFLSAAAALTKTCQETSSPDECAVVNRALAQSELLTEAR